MSTSKIKDSKFQIILNQFNLISEVVMTQLSTLHKLLEMTLDYKETKEEIDNNEMIIDRIELKMREEIAYTILMFAPKAEDLRRIISYQDITTNLERVGDLVLNCIEDLDGIDLDRNDTRIYQPLLFHMMDDVIEMVQSAIHSFSVVDVNLAQKVILSDDNVDDQMRNTIHILSENYANKVLSQQEISEMLLIQSIVRDLERCGDAATNIAESTIYLVNGRSVRHPLAMAAEKEDEAKEHPNKN